MASFSRKAQWHQLRRQQELQQEDAAGVLPCCVVEVVVEVCIGQ
jgi:hypothetical protein